MLWLYRGSMAWDLDVYKVDMKGLAVGLMGATAERLARHDVPLLFLRRELSWDKRLIVGAISDTGALRHSALPVWSGGMERREVDQIVEEIALGTLKKRG